MGEAERKLLLFLRLLTGEKLQEKDVAVEYDVEIVTIRRDFNFFKNFFECNIVFSGSLLQNDKKEWYFEKRFGINKQQCLVISKILLENRAFNSKENNQLLDALFMSLNDWEKKEVNHIIASEKLNYAPLSDQQDKINKIWEFSEFIRTEQVIDFTYKGAGDKEAHSYSALFVSLYYDAHYFYLKAYNSDWDQYRDFRLDRLLEWKLSSISKPKIDFRNKFRDGDVRNYKVDAFNGDKIQLRVLYTATPSVILDKFPTAKVEKETDEGIEFRIETQNTFGLKRYLISQLDYLKVLSPAYLVDDIKETLHKMIKNYD